jgi:hypothetical protein
MVLLLENMAVIPKILKEGKARILLCWTYDHVSMRSQMDRRAASARPLRHWRYYDHWIPLLDRRMPVPSRQLPVSAQILFH